MIRRKFDPFFQLLGFISIRHRGESNKKKTKAAKPSVPERGPLEAASTKLNVKIRRRKLFYQSSYRGMAEMEYILHSFAEKHLPTMNNGELTEWENILRTGDSPLYKWIVEKKPLSVCESLRRQKVSKLLLDAVQDLQLHKPT